MTREMVVLVVVSVAVGLLGSTGCGNDDAELERLTAEVAALRAERTPAAASVGDPYLREAERLAATHRSTTDDEALELARASIDVFGDALDGGEPTPADLRVLADGWAFNAYWTGEAGCVAARDAALRIAAGVLRAADALAAGNDELAFELSVRFDREALDAVGLVTACQP